MLLSIRLIGCAVAVALPLLLTPAVAAEHADTLDAVVVTATRTAQTQDETLASVTVITREQIELLQPASLIELLQGTPGMSISNNGGPGKAGSLFLRGTSGSQLLVLVDGMRIGSVSFGGASLPYIPLAQVERIEIVRGPYSSLYGSDAIGGVVQIFLRHDPGSFVPHAEVGVGSWQTRKAAAGFSAGGERGWLSVEASHQRTDGINACRIGAAAAFAGCFMDEPDRDGFNDTAVSVHGSYRFNQRWSVDGLAFRSEGDNQYDVSVSDGDRYSIQTVGGQLHYQPAQAVRLGLRVGSSTDFATSVLAGLDTAHFNSRRTMASLQADIGDNTNLWTLGYDWERQALASSTVYTVSSRIVRGTYVQWQGRLGAQSLQANLRRDHNSQFGDKTTGSLLWGWDIDPALRLVASYGTAFRAPTFNDLYFPGYGNPALRPENSRNLQLGLRATQAWGHWSLEAYHNSIRDMISFDAASYRPANIGQARITGIEGVLGARLAGWDVQGTASWMRARNHAPGAINDGNVLPRRAERSLHVDADRRFGVFNLGASWHLASSRFEDIGNRQPLGGYGLLDLRAGWQVRSDWRVELAVRNVLNKQYETAWFFNQPDRNFMLTLHWRPQG